MNPKSVPPTELATSEKSAGSTTLGYAGASGGEPHGAAQNIAASAGGELPRLAGFEIKAELASGGMGVVYQAHDLALNRTVAIKVLRDGFPADSPIAQRFLEEAQITAQLQHPGIPPIYQVGSLADGRPFLAMKLIKGETLEARIRRGEKFNYLALIEAIAQAVGYAHAHGVIHRDLKPANVMVGPYGEVQVMDWGLAKLLAASDADGPRTSSAAVQGSTIVQDPRAGVIGAETQMGSILGTPAYMAPEQAAGEIDKVDQRSDVFGLGAVLCSLLTGLPPYQGNSIDEVRRKAYRGQTDEAFARLNACRAEPEVVDLCRRCLAFHADERPSDGNAVAREVAALRQAAEERAKQAEIEEAQIRISAAEQGKRRRLILMAGSALIGVLLVGMAASFWQMKRAVSAENDAVLAAQAERLAKEVAQRERDAKEQERQYAEAIADFVRDDFLALSSLEGQERFGSPQAKLQPNLSMREMLDRAAEKLRARRDLAPRIEADLWWMIGVNYRGQGLYSQAVDALERCVKLRGVAYGPEHFATHNAEHSLALAYAAAGRYAESIQLFEQTRAAFTRELGPEHLDTLATLHCLAGVYRSVGRWADAIQLLEQVRAHFTAQLNAEHPYTLTVLNDLAVTYQDAGRLAEALQLLEQVRISRDKELGADHPDTLETLGNLAAVYVEAGRLPEAVRLFEQAHAGLATQLGSEHPNTLTSLANLATTYWAMNDFARSVPLFEEVLRRQEASLGRRHVQTQLTLANLGVNYVASGRAAEAVPLLEEANAFSKDYPTMAWVGLQLLDAYAKAGNSAAAKGLAASLLNQARASHPAGSLELVNSLNWIARALVEVNDYTTAEVLLRECAATRTKLQPDVWTTFNTSALLGEALLQQKRFAEAEALLLKGYEGMKQRAASIPPQAKSRLPAVIDRLIELYTATEHPDNVRKWQAERERWK